MNKGTKLRTLAGVIVAINQALAATETIDFGSEKANSIYKIISWGFTVAAMAVLSYYNNDYTEEAALGTAYTRQLKAEQKADYVGETFFNEEEVGDDGEQDNL